MLGVSSSIFDACIGQVAHMLKPQSVLELGCGKGKFGALLKQIGRQPATLNAVQKVFAADEPEFLQGKGYSQIIDRDIMEYYREGFDEQYDLIVALDVIEHFLISDVMSIINFSLYRANHMLLVWPSAHPQAAVSNPFDRHRSSFELKDLTDKFDVVFYSQTGFAQMHAVHRYHVALIRGFMNTGVVPPIL